MSDSESIKAIQERMQQVRHDLGDGVEHLVESAKDMTDWRKYMKANPWLCLAAAGAVGFLIVPKKTARYRLNDSDLKAIAKQAGLKVESSKGGMRKAIISLVGSAIMRGALGYLGQRMNQQQARAGEETRYF